MPWSPGRIQQAVPRLRHDARFTLVMLGRAEVARTVDIGPAISRVRRSARMNCVPRGSIWMNDAPGPIQALSQGGASARRSPHDHADVAGHRTNV